MTGKLDAGLKIIFFIIIYNLVTFKCLNFKIVVKAQSSFWWQSKRNHLFIKNCRSRYNFRFIQIWFNIDHKLFRMCIHVEKEMKIKKFGIENMGWALNALLFNLHYIKITSIIFKSAFRKLNMFANSNSCTGTFNVLIHILFSFDAFSSRVKLQDFLRIRWRGGIKLNNYNSFRGFDLFPKEK